MRISKGTACCCIGSRDYPGRDLSVALVINHPQNIHHKIRVAKCSNVKAWDKYHLHDGFIFRANKLCIPECSLRLMLLQESHSGGLMGHFGREKTLLMLAEKIYWAHMRRDVYSLCNVASLATKQNQN